METEFNDDPLFALEEIHRQSKEMTATNEADIVIAMFKKTPDYPVDFCGAVNFFDLSVTLDMGVIVANCGYDTYTVAHEFGHALGIDHSRDIPSQALPFIESAQGYVDPVTGYCRSSHGLWFSHELSREYAASFQFAQRFVYGRWPATCAKR